MAIATASREKRETLPTATMVKRPRRKTAGKPSAARQRRVRDRLANSAFTRDDI